MNEKNVHYDDDDDDDDDDENVSELLYKKELFKNKNRLKLALLGTLSDMLQHACCN